MGKEAIFSSKVTNWLRKHNINYEVNTGSIYTTVGRPDLEVYYKGHCIFLELKTGDYQPDPLQVEYLNNMRNNGFYAIILRETIDELKNILYCIDCNIKYEQEPLPVLDIPDLIFE